MGRYSLGGDFKVSELGECRECVTRKKDHSEKELHKCFYCGESFCIGHMDAKHVHIPSLKATHRHARLVSAMKRDWEREGGHPCFQYSYTYSERTRAREIKEALDRMRGTTPWWKKQKRERKIVGTGLTGLKKRPHYSRKYKSKGLPKKRIIKNVIAFILIIALIGGVYHHRAFVISTLSEFIEYEPSEISSTITPVQTPITIPVQTPTPTPAEERKPLAYEELEHNVVELVNAIRNERGSPSLIWDNELYLYSKQHSEAMASRGHMFHSSMYAPYAENAWWGYGTRWEANDIVESWMSSPRHKTWLICPHLKHVAVGIAVSDTGMYASWTFWRNETQYEDWWYATDTSPPDWWY